MSMDAGRKLAVFLIAVLAVPALLSGAATAADMVSVTFPAGAYEVQETADGQKVLMEGFGRLPDQGKPYLPSKIFFVAVPPGAEVTGVTFETGERVELDKAFSIAPVPLFKVCGQENPQVEAERLKEWQANHDSVYNGTDSYPASPVEFLGMAGYRKYNLAQVRVSPMEWNPQSGQLASFSEITVQVHYALPERLPDDVVLIDNQERTEKIARDIVANYEQAQAWYPGGAPKRGLYDYVIITLDTLTTAVQPLVDWEVSKGRTVNVVTTTWISANYTGYDLAERMRNFLRDKYPSAQWGIEDVCLIGHYDNVHMRRCWQDLGYGKPETDYYYAELSQPDSTSWDANGNHQWGENSDPIDFIAEVNVGRIPWSDVATVTNICNKSVAYEQNNDPSFKQNILLLGAFFWPNTDNAVLMTYKTNPTHCPWMSDWTSTKLYEVGYTSYSCDADLKWTNVRNTWSAGKYAFVNWAGHGSPTGCYIYYSTGEAFADTTTCNALNDDYPSIIFADACSNSDTDHLNLGQAMLKQGGVGFLGSTKVAYGCPGWNHPNDGSSQSLDYYFTSSVTSCDYTQGAGHQHALRTMVVNGLWGSTKYEMFEWGALWGQPNLGMGFAPALSFVFSGALPEGTQPPGLENKITMEIRDGLENYVPGTGKLHYRFDHDDPYTEVAVTPLGGNFYEAVIPNTKPLDEPEYYFSAQGDGGTMLYSPHNAPGEVYSFDVCFVELMMEDYFEVESGWTVVNTNVQTGAWERADPVGTTAQPGDDHTPAGTKCFVTGASGGGAGDNDLDGGPTRLFSPELDLSSGDAMISFWTYFHHTDYGTQEPLFVHVRKDSSSAWKQVMNITHSPMWTQRSFQVSDYITPTATVQLRISAEDNPNDDIVEALVDDFLVENYIFDPALWADGYSISCAVGAVIDLSLDASAANAGRSYIVLGTLSGTSPGFALPGGMILPTNWDAFTDLIMMLLNTAVFQSFMGTLDGAGTASATVNTFGALDPVLVGETAHFAFTLGNPYDFVSNAIPVTFDP
ncbi:MAG: C25 family cysteine peptidase [Planctomycetota bacterium]